MAAPDITTRAWLSAVLDEAGRRLSMATEAGATDPTVCWTVGDISVTAALHGDGVTITSRAPDGTTPVEPLKLPAGWLDA
jgi:hypothetical protein